MIWLDEPRHSVMLMTPVESLCHSVYSDRASPELGLQRRIDPTAKPSFCWTLWLGWVKFGFWNLHLRFITSPSFISVCLTSSSCTWTPKALPCWGTIPSWLFQLTLGRKEIPRKKINSMSRGKAETCRCWNSFTKFSRAGRRGNGLV